MEITLNPVRGDYRPQIVKSGEVLEIDGESFDFSQIPDGAALPGSAVASPLFCDLHQVRRVGGVLCLVLTLPHGPAAPPETLFPEPLIDPPDGPLALPPFDAPPQEDD